MKRKFVLRLLAGVMAATLVVTGVPGTALTGIESVYADMAAKKSAGTLYIEVEQKTHTHNTACYTAGDGYTAAANDGSVSYYVSADVDGTVGDLIPTTTKFVKVSTTPATAKKEWNLTSGSTSLYVIADENKENPKLYVKASSDDIAAIGKADSVKYAAKEVGTKITVTNDDGTKTEWQCVKTESDETWRTVKEWTGSVPTGFTWDKTGNSGQGAYVAHVATALTEADLSAEVTHVSYVSPLDTSVSYAEADVKVKEDNKYYVELASNKSHYVTAIKPTTGESDTAQVVNANTKKDDLNTKVTLTLANPNDTASGATSKTTYAELALTNAAVTTDFDTTKTYDGKGLDVKITHIANDYSYVVDKNANGVIESGEVFKISDITDFTDSKYVTNAKEIVGGFTVRTAGSLTITPYVSGRNPVTGTTNVYDVGSSGATSNIILASNVVLGGATDSWSYTWKDVWTDQSSGTTEDVATSNKNKDSYALGTGKYGLHKITLTAEQSKATVTSEELAFYVTLGAQATVDFNSAGSYKYTYTGKEIKPTVTKSSTAGTPSATIESEITYYYKEKDGSTWKSGLPTEIGEYNVKYSIPANLAQGYCAEESNGETVVKIEKGTPSVNAGLSQVALAASGETTGKIDMTDILASYGSLTGTFTSDDKDITSLTYSDGILSYTLKDGATVQTANITGTLSNSGYTVTVTAQLDVLAKDANVVELSIPAVSARTGELANVAKYVEKLGTLTPAYNATASVDGSSNPNYTFTIFKQGTTTKEQSIPTNVGIYNVYVSYKETLNGKVYLGQATTTLTITPDVVAISAKDQTVKVGDSLTSYWGDVTYTLNGKAVASATATAKLTAVPTVTLYDENGTKVTDVDTTKVGTYTIQIAATAATNAEVTVKNGTITVEAKSDVQEPTVEEQLKEVQDKLDKATEDLEQANTDKATAEAAQKKAEADKATAEAAQKKAEADKATAEAAQKKAEADKSTAEAAQKAAEEKQAAAEKAQAAAEAAQKAAEDKAAAATTTAATKVGDTVKVDGNTYKVTNVKSKTVSFAKVKKNAKTVNIVSSVEINGVTYKVTSIAASAFKGDKKLTSVTIPSTVKTIGKNAFNGCTKLKTITINSSKITKIGSKAFSGVSKKAVVKAPSKKVKAYKKLLKKAKFTGSVKKA